MEREDYPNGTTKYIGNKKDDKYHGQGKLYYEDGTLKYEGRFREGLYDGQGNEYNTLGVLVSSGKRTDGKLNGRATIFYDDGTKKYEGMFRDDRYDGVGKEFDRNGELIYDGQYRNGLFDGYGKEYYRNELVYEGNFRNGKRDGENHLEIKSISVQKSNKSDEFSFIDDENKIDTESYEILNNRRSFDELMKEFNQLIGLEEVKKNVNSMINLVKIQQLRKNKGIMNGDLSHHLVFTGNPGTGKTTVARLIGEIYREIGVLKKGHLIETDRSGLVAGYIGQTALKVKKVTKEAYGGVLFIDEAYSLHVENSENDFGKEAIDTLLKEMEDNRDNLLVIVAGYEGPMRSFLQSNPGLQSRFNKFIDFEDYSSDDLYNIFELIAKKNEYFLDKEAKVEIRKLFEYLVRNKATNFSNGRLVRNIFEKLIIHQSNRLAKIDNLNAEALMLITIRDFEIFRSVEKMESLK